MNIKNKLLVKTKLKNKFSLKTLKFISIGVACNAFVVLHKRGILKDLSHQGYWDDDELMNNLIHPNPHIIRSALKSLYEVEIVDKNKNLWFLTVFGHELIKNSGLINLIFSGYRKVLAKQINISEGYELVSYDDYDGEAIAEASDDISNENTEQIFIQLIKEINLEGKIVDLGCGSGKRLINICRETEKKGIGLDISYEAIKLAKRNSKNLSGILFEQTDIRKINKPWNDVDIIMQNFMVHDIEPDDKCLEMFNLLKLKFPNMKYHIILDIVSSEIDDRNRTINPGFEYIHSLLGIKTRTYNEFLNLFKMINCQIVKEIKIDILPNTYIWVLKISS